ncbi:MAG: NUDIX domain-containing protein [Candidatus Aenigmatarchaeota archaeon]
MEKAKKPIKREFSAGGVVFHRTGGALRILLIKDSYGRWALPKGHIGDTIKGETSEQAALRECSEETGIPISDLKIVGKLGDIKYFYQLKGERRFKIVRFFLIESASSRLKPQWEVQAAEWLEPDEALERIGYENTKSILKSAIAKAKAMAN